jgi:hypothetical protein
MSQTYSLFIERATNCLNELDLEFESLRATLGNLNMSNSELIAEFELVLANQLEPVQQEGNGQMNKLIEMYRTATDLTDQLGRHSVKVHLFVRDVEFRNDELQTLTYLKEVVVGEAEKGAFEDDFADRMMEKARDDRADLTQHCFKVATDAAEKFHRKISTQPIYAKRFCTFSINQEQLILNNRRIFELEHMLISINQVTRLKRAHIDLAQKMVLEVQYQNTQPMDSVEALRFRLSELKQSISDTDIGFIDLRYRTGATLTSVEKLTKSLTKEKHLSDQQS